MRNEKPTCFFTDIGRRWSLSTGRISPRGELRRRPIRYGGFTLIELLIVITIIGILSATAIPFYNSYREKIKIATCILGIGVIQKTVLGFYAETGRYPASLAEVGMDTMIDPWGNPYQYLRIAGADDSTQDQNGNGNNSGGGGGQGAADKCRKDHNLHPINTDFDLYSMGPDGDSKAPLTAQASRDDIIRANDGNFIGEASKY